MHEGEVIGCISNMQLAQPINCNFRDLLTIAAELPDRSPYVRYESIKASYDYSLRRLLETVLATESRAQEIGLNAVCEFKKAEYSCEAFMVLEFSCECVHVSAAPPCYQPGMSNSKNSRARLLQLHMPTSAALTQLPQSSVMRVTSMQCCSAVCK